MIIPIQFKGTNYLLVGGNLNTGGAIATQEEFEEFRISYAHLNPDGNVKRFGKIIGTVKDIKILTPKEVEDAD